MTALIEFPSNAIRRTLSLPEYWAGARVERGRVPHTDPDLNHRQLELLTAIEGGLRAGLSLGDIPAFATWNASRRTWTKEAGETTESEGDEGAGGDDVADA